MAPNPEVTRQRLITAAETLLSERGIDAVSLREINAAAGQRNATALQYHFHDRRGLVRAVLAKHQVAIDAARHELLDEYEARDVDDLRDLVAALVRPSAAKLADPEGGRAYLRIYAQVINRPGWPGDVLDDPAPGDSTHRWRALVGPLLPEVAVRRLHQRFAAMRVSATELARRAADTPRRDDLLFTSNLIDLVTALLGAPISAETRALLVERGEDQLLTAHATR